MKNSSDNIGNRTRDLPACSAVPQTTAPPRAPGLEIHWSCNSTMLQGTTVNSAQCIIFFSSLGNGSVLPNWGSARNRGISAF